MESKFGNKLGLAALAVLLAVSVIANCASKDRSSVQSVSLVQLVTNPTRFENRVVSVTGYLGSRGNLYLFLSRDHALASDFTSSVLLSDTIDLEIFGSDCLNKYARIVGFVTFFEDGGHRDLIIQDISLVEDAESFERCWPSD